jgi:hypothetical protein
MFPSGKTGEMYLPDSVVNFHKKILRDVGLENLRFHGHRHPYVKYPTKIHLCKSRNSKLPICKNTVSQS